MKKVLSVLLFIITITLLSGCSFKQTGEICKTWKGYLSNPDEKKIEITINFIGNEVNKDGAQVLKAKKLTITGDNFTNDIEFKSPEGSKSLKSWVFITESTDPQYPYGIVSISCDYKDITGQIPMQETLETFYSTDIG